MRNKIGFIAVAAAFALNCGNSAGGDGRAKSAGGAGGEAGTTTDDGGASVGGSAGVDSGGAGTGASAGSGAAGGGGTAGVGAAAGASGSGATAGAAGSGATAGAGGTTLSADCPATPPAQLSSCTNRDLVCEYGDDQNPRCNTVAWCQQSSTGDVWTLDVEAPAMGECPTVGRLPFNNPQMGCPSERPRLGGVCSGDLTCLYAFCEIPPMPTHLYILMKCENGTWRQNAPLQGYACPLPP